MVEKPSCSGNFKKGHMTEIDFQSPPDDVSNHNCKVDATLLAQGSIPVPGELKSGFETWIECVQPRSGENTCLLDVRDSLDTLKSIAIPNVSKLDHASILEKTNLITEMPAYVKQYLDFQNGTTCSFAAAENGNEITCTPNRVVTASSSRHNRRH